MNMEGDTLSPKDSAQPFLKLRPARVMAHRGVHGGSAGLDDQSRKDVRLGSGPNQEPSADALQRTAQRNEAMVQPPLRGAADCLGSVERVHGDYGLPCLRGRGKGGIVRNAEIPVEPVNYGRRHVPYLRSARSEGPVGHRLWKNTADTDRCVP